MIIPGLTIFYWWWSITSTCHWCEQVFGKPPSTDRLAHTWEAILFFGSHQELIIWHQRAWRGKKKIHTWASPVRGRRWYWHNMSNQLYLTVSVCWHSMYTFGLCPHHFSAWQLNRLTVTVWVTATLNFYFEECLKSCEWLKFR